MSFYSTSWATKSYVVSVGNNGIGNKGVIVYSSNQGVTWKTANVTTGVTFRTLTDIASYSQNNYFLAVDYYSLTKTGTIYVSTNGGSKWTVAATKYNNGKKNLPRLNGIAIGSNGNSYAVGYSFGGVTTIFKSSIGSSFSAWTNSTTLNDAQFTFFGVGTNDGQTVIAVGTYQNADTFVGYGVIYYSSNAGGLWSSASTGSADVTIVYCVSVVSANVAMVAGDKGSSYSIKFHSISMVSTTIAFVAGFTGSTCTIYKTIDGGISWFQDATGFSSIYSLAMLNVNLGVAGAVAGSGLYVSVADPTSQPSRRPSTQPSSKPTYRPSSQPVCFPSSQPSRQPQTVPTQQPNMIPTTEPSNQPSGYPTLQPRGTPTSQPSHQPDCVPTSIPSTPSGLPSCSPTLQPSHVPSMQPSVHPSSLPSNIPSSVPSVQPSCMPTSRPYVEPSCQPSSIPTHPTSRPATSIPSRQPTVQPTSMPSSQPKNIPTTQPNSLPSSQPFSKPTYNPSCLPSNQPTLQPVLSPTREPSRNPSLQPSAQPYAFPSAFPSHLPSMIPSKQPSIQPTSKPSFQPTSYPSEEPSRNPTSKPSAQPYAFPSAFPSHLPSMIPSKQPSIQPTLKPSTPSSMPSIMPIQRPTNRPSRNPTNQPLSTPSAQPTHPPSCEPSSQPIHLPTSQPIIAPSRQPTMQPIALPSSEPTTQYSQTPSCQPTFSPSIQPTVRPFHAPSTQPTRLPSTEPTEQPLSVPSQQPFFCPSSFPTEQPFIKPSSRSSARPTKQPVLIPTLQPFRKPSSEPTFQPTMNPSQQPINNPSIKPTQQPLNNQPTSIPTTSMPTHYPTGRIENGVWNQVIAGGGSDTLLGASWFSNKQCLAVGYVDGGGVVLDTANRGNNWNRKLFHVLRPLLGVAHYTNSVTYYLAVTDGPLGGEVFLILGSVLKSCSSSPQISCWTRVFGPTPNELSLNSIVVGSNGVAFTVGYGLVYSSPAPFTSWSDVSPQSLSETIFYGVSSFDGVRTLIVGAAGCIAVTTDSGQSWTQVNSNTAEDIYSISQVTDAAVESTLYSLSFYSTNIGLAGDNLGHAFMLTPAPTAYPTSQPSTVPTSVPFLRPSVKPSCQPFCHPSSCPTTQPSIFPTLQPLAKPSNEPSSTPSYKPSTRPSFHPSSQPILSPSSQPLTIPSETPSRCPSIFPSVHPSRQPTLQAALMPTNQPSNHPSDNPSSLPTTEPTTSPTEQVSSFPSSVPSVQPNLKPSQQPVVGPTVNPSIEPFISPTGSPTKKPYSLPSALPSLQPSSVPSSGPSMNPLSHPTYFPTVQPNIMPSNQPFIFPSSQPSSRPSGDPSIHPTIHPSIQPSLQPTMEPTGLPTMQPNNRPLNKPSVRPTTQPSICPSTDPTTGPSFEPTSQPSLQPFQIPVGFPTDVPSAQPFSAPSRIPSRQPTKQPQRRPTCQPSRCPSSQPSRQPRKLPTIQPIAQPSMQPSLQPFRQPSVRPSEQPYFYPTILPSIQPSNKPSGCPTSQPLTNPSTIPTSQPNIVPTRQPTKKPSGEPSAQPTQPSLIPSCQPSTEPSIVPTEQPTVFPSCNPSIQPSIYPSCQPSKKPTLTPTGQPSQQPSSDPTTQPSLVPSQQPRNVPSTQPSLQPSGIPSEQPSGAPSNEPSTLPSQQPTYKPTQQPSQFPSTIPSQQPTIHPSIQPTSIPSTRPSNQPTFQPSSIPTLQPTFRPSTEPSQNPTMQPSIQPSRLPTAQPSTQPTQCPSTQPSNQPQGHPTTQPTSFPSNNPSSHPTMQPTEQPTVLPTVQPTIQPLSKPSAFPSAQPTIQPSCLPTEDPTAQPTKQPSNYPTSQPIVNPSRQPTGIPTATPSNQPSIQPSISPSVSPSYQPTYLPSIMPSIDPSNQPTSLPTSKPSNQPSGEPTCLPTNFPSLQPSVRPSIWPTIQPTIQPAVIPTEQPTALPTDLPTYQPWRYPSRQPSSWPTVQPSIQPSLSPSSDPTQQPDAYPSGCPSSMPTLKPSEQPSITPSILPTCQPSINPTLMPSLQPTKIPTIQPSSFPTNLPTQQPSIEPSLAPTSFPSSQPTCIPTHFPSGFPTKEPSRCPSNQPVDFPSHQPSLQPSNDPSANPTKQPSVIPSCQPFMMPTIEPSQQPTVQPTTQPLWKPTSRPSCQPVHYPSAQPFGIPSNVPTLQPFINPSVQPSVQPTCAPTIDPSCQPSQYPSHQPNSYPTSEPSNLPTTKPSEQPSSTPSSIPTNQPLFIPSNQPLQNPSSLPTSQPRLLPSSMPTVVPSFIPSTNPSCQPSIIPSMQPRGFPSIEPSIQPSIIPSKQPMNMPSTEPSNQPICRPTHLPTKQPSHIPTRGSSLFPSRNPTKQPNNYPTRFPSKQPSRSPSCEPTNQPTFQPVYRPSSYPSRQPSANPSRNPTKQPSAQPHESPTLEPSKLPTRLPTHQPLEIPSSQPSKSPSNFPTSQPFQLPSSKPTFCPSQQDTSRPSNQPKSEPTQQPLELPTLQPTKCPSMQPNSYPTMQPINFPSTQPFYRPSQQPIVRSPSTQPTQLPLCYPSKQPSLHPLSNPSRVPSHQPVSLPTYQPVQLPSRCPSKQPFSHPSAIPVCRPSFAPSRQPARIPSSLPSQQPVFLPSGQPNRVPSAYPSIWPTAKPLLNPSYQPLNNPSLQPSRIPSFQPTLRPIESPSNKPSVQPSTKPSFLPSICPSISPTMQPSAQPLMRPSKQPSLMPVLKPSAQPTTQPTTSQPTSLPSSRPSRKPKTSTPTKEGQTKHPIPSPTSNPTYEVIDYSSTLFYREYFSLKQPILSDPQNRLTFTSFNFKGVVSPSTEGNCNQWQDFIQYGLSLPYDYSEYSSLTVYAGAYDFSSAVSLNTSITCSNRDFVSNLVFSLQNGLRFNQICDSYRYQVADCPVDGVVFCVNCKRPCQPTVCQSPLLQQGIFFSPCTNCKSRKAFWEVLDIKYSNLKLCPNFTTPISVTTSRTSVLIQTTVDKKGLVYCAALLPSVAVTSPLMVKSYSTGPTVVSEPGDVNISISNLISYTKYNIYCYTEDFFSSAMDINTVLGTRKTIVTGCCPKLSVLQSFSAIPESDSTSYTFSFGVDTTGINLNVVVEITEIPKTSPCSYTTDDSSTSLIAVSTANFSFTANTTDRTGVFFIVNAASGCYDVTLTLSNFNTAEFLSTYKLPLTIFGTYLATVPNPALLMKSDVFGKFSSHVLPQSAVSNVGPPPPQMQSAVLASDGSHINIRLDSKSDRGYSYNPSLPPTFSCNLFITFKGSDQATCKFDSDQLIIANFGSISSRAVVVYDNVTLLSHRLKALSCLNTAISCLFSDTNSVVALQPPLNPIRPNIKFSAPAIISICSDLVVDPTSSTGSGGRLWQSVVWEATPPNATSTKLTQWLNKNYQTTDSFVLIPSHLLTVGVLEVKLFLKNMFSMVAISAVSIKVISLQYVTSVSIAGPKFLVMQSSVPLNLFASIKLSSCDGSSSAQTNATVVLFQWTVYQDGVQLPALSSVSSDPMRFRLPGNSLQPLTTYSVKVAAFAATKPYISTSANVQVQVVSNDVSAIISGGSDRVVTLGSKVNTLILNGSLSYDTSQLSSSSLIYIWSCTDVTKDPRWFGQKCPVDLTQTPIVKCDLSYYYIFLRTNQNRTSIQRSLSFSLRVVNSNGASGSVSVVVHLSLEKSNDNIPLSLSLNPPSRSFNLVDKIVVTGSTTASSPSNGSWYLYDQSMNLLNDSFLVPPSFIIKKGLQSLQQSINAAVLMPGFSYSVMLKSGDVYSSIVIKINSPPTGGVATISPLNGTALLTVFALQTFQWISSADSFPIYYEWSYSNSDNFASSVTLQSATMVPYLSSVLGEGEKTSMYMVSCAVIATNSLGASSSAINTYATVLPYKASISSMNKVLEQSLKVSFAQSDSSAAVRLINAVNTIANRANCSLRSNAYCKSLNRNNCGMQSNKCGICLTGYDGPDEEGHPPIACIATLQSRRLETVKFPQKSCINSCSNRGRCIFLSFSGKVVGTCAANDAFCSPVCRCNSTFYGADCSSSYTDHIALQSTRDLLCSGLNHAVLQQDLSMTTIQGFASSLEAALQDYTQMNVNSTSSCAYSLIKIINTLATQAIGNNRDIIIQIIRTLSHLLDTSITNNLLSMSVLNDIEAAVVTMTTALRRQSIQGEDFSTGVASQFSYVTGIANAKSNQALSIPQLSLSMSSKPRVPDSLVIQSNSTAEVTMFQYNVDIYKANTLSAGVHYLVNAISANNSSIKVQVNLQNIEPTSFYVSPVLSGSVSCLKTGSAYNISVQCWKSDVIVVKCPGSYGIKYSYNCPTYSLLPKCVVWDGIQFTTHKGCQLHSFSDDNVTCVCSPSVHKRRLSSSLSSGISTTKVSSIAVYTSTSFSKIKVYSGPITNPMNSYNQVIIASFAAFVALLLILLISISYVDGITILSPFSRAKDKLYQLYPQFLDIRLNNYRFCDCYHGKYAHARNGVDGSVLQKFMQRNMNIDNFFHSILPKEFTYLPWIRKFVFFLRTEHDWLCFTSVQPKSKSKSLRKSIKHMYSSRSLLLAFKILTYLLFDTIFIYSFYRDDGSCEKVYLEQQCLSKVTLFSAKTCTWNPGLDKACEFNQSGLANAVVILFLAAILIIIAVPIEHLLVYVIVRWTVYAEHAPAAEVHEINEHPVSSTKKDGSARAKDVRKISHGIENQLDDAIHAERQPSLETIRFAFEQNKSVVKCYELSASIHQKDKYWRAARLRKLQLLTDLKSSRKEISALLNEIHLNGRVKISDFSAAPKRRLVNMWRSLFQTSAVEFEDNLDRNIINFVSDEVKYSRLRAKHVRRVLKSFGSDHDKEVFLLQLYLAESLPTELERNAAAFLLFDGLEMALPDPWDWWIVSVLSVVLSLYAIFAVIYVFIYGSLIGSQAATYWLIIAFICCFQDLFLSSTLRVLMKWIGLSSICCDSLQSQHQLLQQRARYLLTRQCGVMGTYTSYLVQHFNPACRAARSCPHLPTSRLLFSLNDDDLPVRVLSRHKQGTSVQHTLGEIVKAVAYVTFLFPRWMHGILFDVWASAFLGALLVALAASSAISIFIPIAVAVIILGLLALTLYLSWDNLSPRYVTPPQPVSTVSAQPNEPSNEIDDEKMRMTDIDFDIKRRIRKPKIEINPDDDYDREDVREFTIYKDSNKKVTWKEFLERRDAMYATIIYAATHPPELTEEEIAAAADKKWALLIDKLRAEVDTMVAQRKVNSSASSINPEESKDMTRAFDDDEYFADSKFKLRLKGKDGKPRQGRVSRVLLRRIEQKKMERRTLAMAKAEEENEFSFDFIDEILSPAFRTSNRRGLLNDEKKHDGDNDESSPTKIITLSGSNIFRAPTPILTTKRPTQTQIMPRELRLKQEKLYRQLQLKQQKEKDEEFSFSLFEAEDDDDEKLSEPVEQQRSSSNIQEPYVGPITVQIRVDMQVEEAKKSMNDEQYIQLLSNTLQQLRSTPPPPRSNSTVVKRWNQTVSQIEKHRTQHLQKVDEEFDFTDLVDIDADIEPSLKLTDDNNNNNNNKQKSSSLEEVPRQKVSGPITAQPTHNQPPAMPEQDEQPQEASPSEPKDADLPTQSSSQPSQRRLPRQSRDRRAAKAKKMRADIQRVEEREKIADAEDFFEDFFSD
eukprot:gene22644-30922_t